MSVCPIISKNLQSKASKEKLVNQKPISPEYKLHVHSKEGLHTVKFTRTATVCHTK